MLMKNDKQTITEDGRLMLDKAQTDQVETVWDRHEAQQPQCGFCDMGLSCRICIMGPCRVDPFGEGPQAGVCGADADIIVARNLCRMIAAGAASHSDHGRDLVEVLAGSPTGKGPAIKSATKPNSGRGRRVRHRHRRTRAPGASPGAGRCHDGRLRHAQKGRQDGARAPEKRAGGVGEVRPHPGASTGKPRK
jgi:hypothetical protein